MKRFVLYFLIFISFIIFVGCARKSGEDVIRYMRWADPSEVASTKELIAMFEKKNPGIKVDFQSESWGAYWDKLQTLLAASDAPDVFLLGASYVVDFYNKGALTDLQELIDNDPDMDLDDFFDPPKEVFTFNGHLYGLPRDINAIVLYYNKNLFDQYGVEYPNKNWTWQDLVEAGKKLTKDLNGDGIPDVWGIITSNDFETCWGNFVYQNKGRVLNKEKTKCLLYEKNAVEAIQFLYDLEHKFKIAPKSAQKESLGGDIFLTGKLAMSIAGSWRIGYLLKSINSFDWDIEELPKGKVKATIANGIANVIYSGTKKKELAWKLVKFLSGKEAQIALAKSGTAVPIRKSIAYSDIYLDGKPANKKAVLDSIAFGRNYPTTEKLGEWLLNAVLPQIDLAFLGKKSVPKAMLDASKEVDRILEKNRAE